MKYLLTLLIIAFSLCQANAQDKLFHLNGTINTDTGTVVLLQTGGKDYYPGSDNKYETKITNGAFSFAGQIRYPYSFRVLIRPNYVSDYFMVEPGSQRIVCNIDSNRETPELDNEIMLTERAVLHARKVRLLSYTREHSDSYTVLWELVGRLDNGYEPVFDTIYSAFSPTLKATHTGRIVAQRLKSSRTTAIGQVFPTLTLLDDKNRRVSLSAGRKAEYTLVDFWFSRCGPCLAEFPELRQVFDQYQKMRFDIIGVSVDKKEDEPLWRKTIEDNGLIWSQYIDLSGELTQNTLSISLFPSNLLLDEKGVIIRKNISPAQLSEFLSQNLMGTK